MDEVELAGAAAERIRESVTSTGSLDAVYASLEAAVQTYASAGGSLDDVIPGGDDDELGFSRGQADGRTFWNRYADALRDDLCQPTGELHKTVSQGLATGGATVVTMLIAALGLPLVAAPIVAPIAGAMLALGVKAMCPDAPPETT
jgi:hypothetical protein